MKTATRKYEGRHHTSAHLSTRLVTLHHDYIFFYKKNANRLKLQSVLLKLKTFQTLSKSWQKQTTDSSLKRVQNRQIIQVRQTRCNITLELPNNKLQKKMKNIWNKK